MTILSQTLRHADLMEGLMISVPYMMLLWVPLAIVLVVVQGLLALAFMSRGRRSWWRSGLVVLPSALLIVISLLDITSLYPPERRARRELAHHLGGPIPTSVHSIKLDYRGGIDPGWSFEFKVSPEDFRVIQSYRDYEPDGLAAGTSFRLIDERSTFFHLEFDPKTGRCRFRKLTT